MSTYLKVKNLDECLVVEKERVDALRSQLSELQRWKADLAKLDATLAIAAGDSATDSEEWLSLVERATDQKLVAFAAQTSSILEMDLASISEAADTTEAQKPK